MLPTTIDSQVYACLSSLPRAVWVQLVAQVSGVSGCGSFELNLVTSQQGLHAE